MKFFCIDLIDWIHYNRANADPSLNNDPGLPDEMGSGDVLEHASDEEEDEDDHDEEVETSENTEENAEADGDKGEADEMSLSLAAYDQWDDVVNVDQVAVTYKELATLRDRIVTIKRGNQPSVKSGNPLSRVADLLIEQMDDVILNTNRIEVLLDELFTLNRHLSSLEGQLHFG